MSAVRAPRTWTEIHHGVGVGVDLIVQEIRE